MLNCVVKARPCNGLLHDSFVTNVIKIFTLFGCEQRVLGLMEGKERISLGINFVAIKKNSKGLQVASLQGSYHKALIFEPSLSKRLWDCCMLLLVAAACLSCI